MTAVDMKMSVAGVRKSVDDDLTMTNILRQSLMEANHAYLSMKIWSTRNLIYKIHVYMRMNMSKYVKDICQIFINKFNFNNV